MKILIVEDERFLARELQDYLKTLGHISDLSHTGRDAVEKVFVNSYDFILLDLGLPDMDGMEVLEEIKKQQPNTSVIILTARGELGDRVQGLDKGADDYLAKPFALPELNSRMNAILRRSHGFSQNLINVHGFTINIDNREVRFGESQVPLTKKEYDIFLYLIMNKNRVITRLQLTEHIWGDVLEINSDSNFVDVHVKNLRKKLGAFASTDWFETVRSFGYKIRL